MPTWLTGTTWWTVSDPYDSVASTISEDGSTAFTTVAFDEQEIGVAEFDQADEATKGVRDAGIQVEYDGGLGYAKGDAEPKSELIGMAVAVVVLVSPSGRWWR